MAAQTIVQYVVVRADLCQTLGWPVGALVAQACHATTAVIHKFYDHQDTQNYLADLDNMHKIVLSVKNINYIFK
jgi:peptidyl-tRNA hydrolase